ncbi:hypothetical protein HYALB_00012748 [Hymenoscyphus albidus]|uniref:Tyrosine--tRNA ligase n=1 Tax=Hymenoscyphus albidus TaxID=595503 RepID=A0A9N9LX45_9HELO|nr:hypothetical protein HYALB_00012748 [Hymenoscyphus albidus]
MATMTPEESVALIKSNLAEVLNPEIIDDVILTQKRPLKVYWGTAPTGKPHCGYFVPMIKIAELLAAGCEVKILLADVHGWLETVGDASFELIQARAKYYEKVIKSMLTAIGVDITRLIFVLGSSYQASEAYRWDQWKFERIVKVPAAIKAGSEVVKNAAEPFLGGLLYPLMQSLDEQYLDVDVQFGGLDQRKIFTFALENLPKLGYKARAHLMNAMVPGLGEAVKMSASDAESKIDLLDSPDAVEKKLRKAKCAPKEAAGNGVVAFVEHVLMRALALKKDGSKFTVLRKDQEPLIYENAEKLKEDYVADIITPQTLKAALTTHLNALLAPIRADYELSQEWKDAEAIGYPTAVKVKKVKKDKGDPEKRAAAAAAAAAKKAVAGAGADEALELEKLPITAPA